MNKTIGIVITDGVGYRNFILSEFPHVVFNEFENVIIYSCLPESAFPDAIRNRIRIVELEIFREGTFTGFVRKTKELAHLYLNRKNNFGIEDNLKVNRNTKFTKRGLITQLSFLIAYLWHSERWILRFTKWQMRSIKYHRVTLSYLALLKVDVPDVLFFTHQRPAFVTPMIVAAEQLGILKAAFIFSWDNIPSKGRMAGNFDKYLVWSELMKKELLQFYPSIMASQVFVGGTPQFEPYIMPKYETEKEAFYTRFNLKPSKASICFSCGDISTSKNDELYISVIAEAMIKKDIEQDINLVVRTSPAEAPDRFYALQKMYSFIHWNYPDWHYAREGHPEPWTQRIPTEKDVKDLRSLLAYCDVNVNMCSTMSLDFLQFDKPVINSVFGNGTNGLYYDQRFLNYAHYNLVKKSKAVVIAKNKEELIVAINEALKYPQHAAKERKNLVDLQIDHSLKGTSERLVNILSEMSRIPEVGA
jgi:hypothetical protein